MQTSTNKARQAIYDDAAPIVRRTCALPGGAADDSAELASRLAVDSDRIAGAMSDIVVRRLFSAGLNLEAALAALGHHAASMKVGLAISELDLAVRDLRGQLFDRSRPD